MTDTSFDDLPKDVVWLVLRHVIKMSIDHCDNWWDRMSFSCRPKNGITAYVANTMIPLSLVCKRFKQVLLPKCTNIGYHEWIFIKGAFD
jgi:hypothetical protein